MEIKCVNLKNKFLFQSFVASYVNIVWARHATSSPANVRWSQRNIPCPLFTRVPITAPDLGLLGSDLFARKICAMAERVSIEIGMQTHSKCVKSKNVHKDSYIESLYTFTQWPLSTLSLNLVEKQKGSSLHGVRSAIDGPAMKGHVLHRARAHLKVWGLITCLECTSDVIVAFEWN